MKSLAIVVMLTIPLISTAAMGDHHLVKRALQEAKCIPQSVQTVQGSAPNLVLEASCLGGPERKVTIVCTRTRCLADDHEAHGPGEDDEP